MGTAEYALQVSLTRAFINTDPEAIVVQHWENYRDPDTGTIVKGFGDPQPPQTVRIMEYGTTSQVREVTTPGGQAQMPELYLLGMPDANIKDGDKFTWHGIDWQVGALHFKPNYELRADVVKYTGS